MQNPKEIIDADSTRETISTEPFWKLWLKRMGIGGFLFFLITDLSQAKNLFF